MSAKEEFLSLLKLTGFSAKVIRTVSCKIQSSDDIEDIMNIVASQPHISSRALLHYVNYIVSFNKGGRYEAIYIWEDACRGA